MKEKTAMQELKEFLHTWTSMDGKDMVCTVDYLNATVKNLLEKEKQQIINAWDDPGHYTTSGEDYYNKVFK